MLTEGAPFPPSDAVDASGGQFRLTGQRARPVVVYFLRSTSCPACGMHVRALMGRREEFAAKGFDLAFVVPERVEAARAWGLRRAAGVPVLAAAGARSVHAQVGLDRKMARTMQQSGTIIVDTDGTTRYVRTATVPIGGYDRGSLDRALDEVAGVHA